MRINFIYKGGSLKPSLPEDAEKLQRFKEGEILSADFSCPRNNQLHRKFFALIGLVVAHTDYGNADQVLHVVKIKLGHYDLVIGADGEAFYMPRSISFAKMDQHDFEAFYSQTVDLVLSYFLPNWNKDDLNEVAEEIISHWG